MLLGADRGGTVLAVGDQIPDAHFVNGSMAPIATDVLKTAQDQAPKLCIPLKEKNHPQAYFAEEQEGWHGYIEWERYPEKKKEAADILSQYAFAEVEPPELTLLARARLTLRMY